MSISAPYYMAPENIEEYRSGTNAPIAPGKKSDIFALGVLLLEMCNLSRSGEEEVDGVALYELREENNRKPRFTEMVRYAKENYKDLSKVIDAVLEPDKDKRPSCAKIIKELVHDKALELVQSAEFQKEMKIRTAQRLELGFASEEDFAKYIKLWDTLEDKDNESAIETNKAKVVDKWVEDYVERIKNP